MKSRSHTLRESIEEKIAVGQLLPGAHLDETLLANEYGVSRTPIREALIQLASMGLVVIRPRRGAIVADTSPQRLVEMFEVMAELEAMCGRLAARRMTKVEHAQLLELHHACLKASEMGDPDDYYYKNEAFHEAIYTGSHNEFLAEQVRNLRRRLRPYRRLQLRVRDRVANSFSEHEKIIYSIIDGDVERAGDLLRNHVMVQGQRFSDLMVSLAQLKKYADPTS
jgi:DNA-binding GntR family transcriptional regulator